MQAKKLKIKFVPEHFNLFHLNMVHRCENFITMCGFHGQYYFSSNDTDPNDKCCGTIFDPKPIFVNTGTCFTSTLEIPEVWPFTFSYIKILLRVDEAIAPGSYQLTKIKFTFRYR